MNSTLFTTSWLDVLILLLIMGGVGVGFENWADWAWARAGRRRVRGGCGGVKILKFLRSLPILKIPTMQARGDLDLASFSQMPTATQCYIRRFSITPNATCPRAWIVGAFGLLKESSEVF